jgi:hypothetical protein
MSKKAKWVLFEETGIAKVTMPETGVSAEFDITRIFPNWPELTHTQKHTVYYGVKQRTSDKTAMPEGQQFTEANRLVIMGKLFEEIVNDTAWKRHTGEKGETVPIAKFTNRTSVDDILFIADGIERGFLPITALSQIQRDLLAAHKASLQASEKGTGKQGKLK